MCIKPAFNPDVQATTLYQYVAKTHLGLNPQETDTKCIITLQILAFMVAVCDSFIWLLIFRMQQFMLPRK